MNVKKTMIAGIAVGTAIGAAILTALCFGGCENEVAGTMQVKEIRFEQKSLQVQKLSERTLTAHLLPDFADIAARIGDITIGTPPSGLSGTDLTDWQTARQAVVDANLALVTWESDNPAVATVAKASGSQLQAKVTAESEGTAHIRIVIAAEGVSSTAVITVIPAVQYTLKVKNNSASPDAATTADNAAVLVWEGERWDGMDRTTVTPPPGLTAEPYILTVKNNDTGAHIGSAGNGSGGDINIGGHMPNSTMVYLTTGIQPPFVFSVTLNLKTALGATAANTGVMAWVSRDTDTPVSDCGLKLSYRHAGIRWFGSGNVRSVFVDSTTPDPNMRNIEGGNVAFPINQEAVFEIEHTGEHYSMRYSGGAVSAQVSDSGYTNAAQKIHETLVDPNADYFPGFHVSGAEVEITGISVIKK